MILVDDSLIWTTFLFMHCSAYLDLFWLQYRLCRSYSCLFTCLLFPSLLAFSCIFCHFLFVLFLLPTCFLPHVLALPYYICILYNPAHIHSPKLKVEPHKSYLFNTPNVPYLQAQPQVEKLPSSWDKRITLSIAHTRHIYRTKNKTTSTSTLIFDSVNTYIPFPIDSMGRCVSKLTV